MAATIGGWSRRGAVVAVLVLVVSGQGALPPAKAEVGAETAASAQGSLPVRSWLAAGDSYSSGEGFPTVDDEACQRSSQAWAPRAKDLVRNGDGGFDARPFDFVACTGAVSSDFDGQREQPSRDRHDLVTFSFGGNDVHFGDTIIQCLGLTVEGFTAAAMRLLPGTSGSWARRGGCPPEEQMLRDIDRDLAGYQGFLEGVANNAVTAGGHVIVVGYPNIVDEPQFWPTVNREVLGTCQGLRVHDAQALRSAAGHLNATIGQAVTEVDRRHPNGVHFTFVDINTGNPDRGVPFDDQNLYEPGRGDRHALCAARPWLNGVVVGRRPDGTWRFQRSFHPTGDGYRATAELVARRARRLDWSHLLPDFANTTYPTGACLSETPLVVAGGESPNAGEGARPDGSDNPQAYVAEASGVGDLDGDGYPDGAGTLGCTLGGATGFTDAWVWLSDTAGHWRQVPRVVDRPDSDSWVWPARGFDVDIRDGTLVVSDYVVQGPSLDEAECCPGTAVSATWRLEGGELEPAGTPAVTTESENPLNAFLVGTSFGFDVTAIAIPSAIAEADALDLRGAQIVDASTCGEGDVTRFCTYPLRRRDGTPLTVEVVWGPPDPDLPGYAANTTDPAKILTVNPV